MCLCVLGKLLMFQPREERENAPEREAAPGITQLQDQLAAEMEQLRKLERVK